MTGVQTCALPISAKPGAKTNPLQKYIEVAGVRFVSDPKNQAPMVRLLRPVPRGPNHQIAKRLLSAYDPGLNFQARGLAGPLNRFSRIRG